MDRKGFINSLFGIAGVAIVAPMVLVKKEFDCPLCEDTGQVVTHQCEMIGEYNFPDKVGPCPVCRSLEYLQAQLQKQVDLGWPRPASEIERIIIMKTRRKGMMSFHNAMIKATNNYKI